MWLSPCANSTHGITINSQHARAQRHYSKNNGQHITISLRPAAQKIKKFLILLWQITVVICHPGVSWHCHEKKIIRISFRVSQSEAGPINVSLPSVCSHQIHNYIQQELWNYENASGMHYGRHVSGDMRSR